MILVNKPYFIRYITLEHIIFLKCQNCIAFLRSVAQMQHDSKLKSYGTDWLIYTSIQMFGLILDQPNERLVEY